MIAETLETVKEYDPQIQIFKALTHPARLAILEILREGEQCVCHMEAKLGCRQAYLSQQLAVLRETGIIQDRREGWNIFYRVVQPEIYHLLDTVKSMTGDQNTLTKIHFSVNDCPCPKCAAKRSVVQKERSFSR